MGPEVWVGILAVFVSGGALGAGGALLTQWMVRNLRGDPGRQRQPVAETERLRAEVAALGERLASIDQRLDFTEQLLEGAIPLSRPPPRPPLPPVDDTEG